MNGGATSLRGDLYGGLSAAIIALPLGLAFGVAAFASLGPDYVATGAMVGLIGCIFTGFFAAWLGGTPTQITGPTGPMTVVVTAFIAKLVATHGVNLPLVLASLAILVTIGGITEIVLGLIGGGRVVKFIPYPVIAGFMNGIAIIIFVGQLKPAFGITDAWSSLSLDHAAIPLVICGITIAAIFAARRWSPRLPGTLMGLIAGMAGYQLLAATGAASTELADNALLIGTIPNPFHDVATLQSLAPAFHLGSLAALPWSDVSTAVSSGLALGLLGAIDSLLTSVVADSMTQTRHDSRRELIGQGVGNIMSGMAGGLAGAGATVRTLVNIDAGGTTRRSGMVHASGILLVVAVLGNLAAWIPLAALAGILFVTAVGMIDDYSLRLMRRRKVRNEIGVMLAVTALTVAVDLIVAVGVGCAIAGLLYIMQQARQPIIYRRLFGGEVFSRTLRREGDYELLRQFGRRTLVYELRGSLFFGTTDQFALTVEGDLASADHFVFDFSRVDDIDLSGAQVLKAVITRIRNDNRTLVVSGLRELEEATPFSVEDLLGDLGILEFIGRDHLFPSLDRALEANEEYILSEHGPADRATHALALHEFDAFAELSDVERAPIEAGARIARIGAGEYLYSFEDTVDNLMLVRRGRLALLKRTDAVETRLTMLGPGSVLGQRALLHRQHHHAPAAVRAETDAELYLIPHVLLEQLAVEHPNLLLHLQRALLHFSMERIDLLMGEIVMLERR
jgi:SulP family sulfate permease